MEANTNLSSLMQLNKMASTLSFNPTVNNFIGHNKGFNFVNDNGAMLPDITTNFSKFDNTMDNFAAFKDMITTANNGITDMMGHGEGIRALLERAREEGLSPESLDALQKEVDTRLEAIRQIRENTNFNGINPFDGVFSLNVPQWQDIFGVKEPENTEETDEEKPANDIKDMIASFDIDMSIGADGFNLGAKATVNIGYTEDGSLQITVDASMDFDLSNLKNEGLNSDSAWDMINNFLAMLTGKQQGLNNASNMVDNLFASLSGAATIQGDGFLIEATNDIDMEGESSKNLKGKIVQHAAITLDSTANQIPSIAINLL